MFEQLSNCERKFIVDCLAARKRLDGRQFNEFRKLSIHFGSEWGCTLVSLGESKVLAQVSCEITQPRATRPTEGILYINVNSGIEKRSSEQIVLLTRHLERALKESRCVDLESLCIKAEEKVWRIRVDLTILNHEGNLVDCASVAALTALAHFKRPDVTTSGEEVIVHTHNEKDPIPIVLHHYPVCVSYSIFGENGEIAIADPSLLEERCTDATVVFGLNSYRELCGLYFGGITLASLELLMKCANQGAKRATNIVKEIKAALEADEKRRAEGKAVGFSECLQTNAFDSFKESRLLLRFRQFRLDKTAELSEEIERIKQEKSQIKSMGKSSAVLLPAEEITDPGNSPESKWIPDIDDDLSDEFYAEENPVAEPKIRKKRKADNDMSDSEEEETFELNNLEKMP